MRIKFIIKLIILINKSFLNKLNKFNLSFKKNDKLKFDFQCEKNFTKNFCVNNSVINQRLSKLYYYNMEFFQHIF